MPYRTTIRISLAVFALLATAVSLGLAIAWAGHNGRVSAVWALDTVIFAVVTVYIVFYLDNSRL